MSSFKVATYNQLLCDSSTRFNLVTQQLFSGVSKLVWILPFPQVQVLAQRDLVLLVLITTEQSHNCEPRALEEITLRDSRMNHWNSLVLEQRVLQ